MLKIYQKHSGSGDNIGGDKVSYRDNIKKKIDIPLWLKYLVAFIGIAGFILTYIL